MKRLIVMLMIAFAAVLLLPASDSSYDPFTPGEKVSIKIPELVEYSAKKLPSGLKLDKKTGSISGTPKKPGTYEVTFSKKGAETLSATFVVGSMPTLSIAMEGDTEKCKVTGASKPGKGYFVGQKVSLAAKAPKGTAFVGWFKGGEPWPSAPEHLNAKQKYVMTAESLSLAARFEKEKMLVACPGFTGTLAIEEEVRIPIEVVTQSGVKSVKGSRLPRGLTVKKVEGVWAIVGTPKKKGTFDTTIKVTAKSGAVEEVLINITVTDKGAIVLPDWAVGTFNGDGIYKPIDLWHGYAEYDFVFTVTVAASGKVSGSITVDVTAGKQETATFSAVSALGYDESAHVVLWWDWNSELGWHEGMTFDGPAYYYDVDIKLGGKTATRRLYVCDMLDGITSDVGRKVEGIAVAGFDYIEYIPWQDIVFCGDAMKNLWADKTYTGPLPKFASSTVTKTVVTEDGDVCTFSFKQNGSVAVKIKRTNGQSDSASFTLEVVPHDGGTWFTADGNWIFPKGAIADVDMVLSPNEKGVITADDIKITDIDVDIDQ